MIPLLSAITVILFQIYITCRPFPKINVIGLIHRLISKLIKLAIYLLKRAYKALIKNASKIIAITLLVYTVYFINNQLKVGSADLVSEAIMDYILTAVALVGFIVLLDEKVHSKSKGELSMTEYKKLQIIKHALQHYIKRPNSSEKEVEEEKDLLRQITEKVDRLKEKYNIK